MAVIKYLSLATAILSCVVSAVPVAERPRVEHSGVKPALKSAVESIAESAAAGRVESVEERNFRFHTQAVKVPKRNGPRALAKALRKFNTTVPKGLSAAAGTESGSVSATPEEFDVEYLSPVSIGGQTLMLDFDTGSSDLWVFSTSLPSNERSGHTAFNPSASSTFETLAGERFRIMFGDGSSASGTVGTDTVTVGGVTVTSQAVELATAVSSSFVSDVDTDGLLGLGFNNINSATPTQVPTFISNAAPSLESPVFTADLNHDAPGTYDFGVIDSSKFTGSITYTPVNTRNGFWEFTATGFGVGTSSFVSGTFDVIADTGTTLLLLPDTIIDDYWGSVQGAVFDDFQGGIVFPCSTTLPPLTLGLGTFRAVIPGSLMNFAPVSSTQCFGAAQSSDGIGFSVLGDILFKATFTVFDVGQTRIGFAPKA